MLFSSKKEEKTVTTLAERGMFDQILYMAVAESVFLWNLMNLSWNWMMLSFKIFLIVFYSSKIDYHAWYKSTDLSIAAWLVFFIYSIKMNYF